MHAEAAAALGDPDKGVQEVRLLAHECGEIRRSLRPGEAAPRAGGTSIRNEVGSARGTQQLFAAAKLGAQAAQCTVGEMLVEIGHDTDHVR